MIVMKTMHGILFKMSLHCHTYAPHLRTFHVPQFKNPGSNLSNALHFVELQDLRVGLLPSLYIE